MSYTFRVVFDGVCAYVPDIPFFKKTSYGGHTYGVPQPVRSLAVLLPDLRRTTTPVLPNIPGLNFPRFREPHFPLLKFRLGDLRKGTTRRVDFVGRDISQQEEEGLLLLRREQIRIYIDAENAKTFSFAGWAPDPGDIHKIPSWFKRLPDWWGFSPDPGDFNQLESLWWLPDLEEIAAGFPGANQAKAEVLPSYQGPFPEGLIARVECFGGRLRTSDFNRGVDGNPLLWRFAPPSMVSGPGRWNRALANSLALEFFDVRGKVRIEVKRLANEVVTEELVLAPATGAYRPELEISISNREPDLLFQEEGFGRSTLPDVDFQPFYEHLSDFGGPVADLPIPHPAGRSFFGIREKPCAGTIMNS